MKTNYKKLFAALPFCLGALLMTACEQEDRTYQGPLYYEYSASECDQSNASNIFVKEAKSDGADQLCVQLIAPASGAVKVNFRVADQLFYLKSSAEYVTELPAGTTAGQYEAFVSTATYGTDFIFAEKNGLVYDAKYKTGSILIPEGELFGYIPLDILQRKGNATYIVLEDSEDARANRPTSILNLKMTAQKTNYFNESLTEGIPSGWSTLDKDGDGLGWYFYEKWSMVISDSYDYDSGDALKPENYLVTPAISIPASSMNPTLSFDIAASATNAYKEKYKIVASETPLTLDNCRDALVLRDYTELTDAHAKKNFQNEQIDLSALKGKTVYIGFVHGDCTDMESLIVKNVIVFGY